MKKIIASLFTLCLILSVYSQVNYAYPEPPPYKGTISIGILNGGGGIVGVDFEALLNDRIGLTAGVGLTSYGIGLNFHFFPGGARSSYINMGYWHQGLNDSYFQSMIGPSFVWRAKRIFQLQLGIGYQLETGPAYSLDETPILLMYSAGVYLPFR